MKKLIEHSLYEENITAKVKESSYYNFQLGRFFEFTIIELPNGRKYFLREEKNKYVLTDQEGNRTDHKELKYVVNSLVDWAKGIVNMSRL